MIHNPRLGVLFVHIQKTAGTSITEAFRAERGSRLIKPHHMRLCDAVLPAERPRIVAVVRNPWERQVSWYRMMVRKGVHNALSAYLLAPENGGADEGATEACVRGDRRSGRKRPVSFSTFLRRTETIEETSTKELARSLRSRLWPIGPRPGAPYLKSTGWNQEDYLLLDGQFVGDDVLRFDRLEEAWAELGEALKPGEGWSRPLPRANSAPKPVDWRSYYGDDRDAEFVATHYARDVARFGFTFDD